MTLKQFNEIYIRRITRLRPLFHCSFTPINTPSTNTTIFGILFMVSDLKPTIFDDLKYYKNAEKHNFYTKDVKWYLEDEHDRILLNNMPNGLYTTGMAVAVVGSHIQINGSFDVTKIIFPELNIHKKQKTELKCKNEGGRVLVVSNPLLDLDNNLGKFKVLLDTVNEMKISNIVLLGSIVSIKSVIVDYKQRIESLCKSSNCQVSIVPGQTDPTSSLFPQEPIHKRILNFNNLHNPDEINLNNRNILLMSGLNVLDILRYKQNSRINVQDDANEYRMHLKENIDIQNKDDITVDDLLNAIEMILKSKLTCPTAPDTLKSLPVDSDKYFITKNYEYVICGLGSELKCRLFEQSMMVVVPDFSKTGQCAFLDVDCNEIKVIKIK